jgi:hypothetical protein
MAETYGLDIPIVGQRLELVSLESRAVAFCNCKPPFCPHCRAQFILMGQSEDGTAKVTVLPPRGDR